MSQWNSMRAKRSGRDAAKMDKALRIAMATVRKTMGQKRLLACPRLQSGLKSSPRFQYPLSERLEWLRAVQQTDGQSESKKKKKKKELKKICEAAVRQSLLKDDRQPFNLDWRPLKRAQTPDALCLLQPQYVSPSTAFSFTGGWIISDFYYIRPETTSLYACVTCTCAGARDLTLVLMAKNKQFGNCGAATSGLILANSCIRRLRGEVIFCTGAQSNQLEGTWPGSQIQFHLEGKSLWIKKSISRMTPGMNHFIRNGKYRGITTRWRPLRQYWGWQKRIY